MSVWIRGIHFISISTIFQLDFRTVPIVISFCFSFNHLFQQLEIKINKFKPVYYYRILMKNQLHNPLYKVSGRHQHMLQNTKKCRKIYNLFVRYLETGNEPNLGEIFSYFQR